MLQARVAAPAGLVVGQPRLRHLDPARGPVRGVEGIGERTGQRRDRGRVERRLGAELRERGPGLGATVAARDAHQVDRVPGRAALAVGLAAQPFAEGDPLHGMARGVGRCRGIAAPLRAGRRRRGERGQREAHAVEQPHRHAEVGRHVLGGVEGMRLEGRGQRVAEAAQRFLGEQTGGRRILGRERQRARAATERPQVAPFEAHVGMVAQHHAARRVVGHAAEQRLRQRQVARGVGAPGRDDAFHRAEVVVARHVVRQALLLEHLELAARLFVVAEAAPQHGLVEGDQRALEAAGRERAREPYRFERARLAGAIAGTGGHRRHQPALARRPLRGHELFPEGRVLQVHRLGRRRGAGRRARACAQAEERGDLGRAGGAPLDLAAHAPRLGRRQPERALAAPLGVEEARLARAVLAPADLDAPGLEVAEGTAHDHAQGARVRHLAAQVGQPHHRGLAVVRMAHAHQQPQRLEGRAPAVDRLRGGELDDERG